MGVKVQKHMGLLRGSICLLMEYRELQWPATQEGVTVAGFFATVEHSVVAPPVQLPLSLHLPAAAILCPAGHAGGRHQAVHLQRVPLPGGAEPSAPYPTQAR